jgi:putative ABC transport system substrate-binding protein
MRRRDFIAGIAGSSAAWPLAARAQQGERIRRIGVLLVGAATGRPELVAFEQTLQQLGWTDGRNLRIEYRSGLGSAAIA